MKEPEPEPDLRIVKKSSNTRKCKFYRYNKEKSLLIQDKKIVLANEKLQNKEKNLVVSPPLRNILPIDLSNISHMQCFI